MSDREPVVTLDGPAGAGKSSTAQAVADALGYRHLDSGALYRGLTYALQEAGVEPARWPRLTEDDFRKLDVTVDAQARPFGVRVGGRVVQDELRAPEVTEWVSRLASLPAARACLLDLQRDAGRTGGLVADGRDMGSVVFPDAEVKVFMVANLEERARRRLVQEGAEEPSEIDVNREASVIEERDRRDSERALSPLRRPDGAVDIDTTALTFEEQVAAIVDRVRALTAS